MDLVDRAQIVETLHREAAVAAHFASQDTRMTRTHCEDCGGSIPEARRRAMPGVTRDVDCQALFERRNRLGGR